MNNDNEKYFLFLIFEAMIMTNTMQNNLKSKLSFWLYVKIQSESENCYKVLKGSWDQIENKASQPGGLETLRKSFKICKYDSFLSQF